MLEELEDVADLGAAPRVHRLVVVAHHGHLLMLLAEQLHQHVLGVVGVLELVDQHVAERSPVVRQPLGKELQHVDRPHDQVVEVHGVQLVQPPLVQPIGRGGDLE